MNFLLAQSAKFQPRVFYFDKDHGAEIFIRALGGTYAVWVAGRTRASTLCSFPIRRSIGHSSTAGSGLWSPPSACR